jgi:cytochrome c
MASNSGFELNKIAGAVLLAGLIGMVSGKVAEYLYAGGPKHPGAQHEEARGYKVEVQEVAAGGPAKPSGPPNIDALYATADIAKGEAYFAKKCAVCHTHEKGGANKVGPNLYGVMNRPFASVAGFSYSKALSGMSDKKWTFEEMNGFQWKPRKWVPGTIMAYAGTKKDQDRANVIAYLATLSDSKIALPVAKPTPAEAVNAAKEGTLE